MVKTRKIRGRKTYRNIEYCPKCKKLHNKMCPYCASPVTKGVHKCPYCKMRIYIKKGGNSSPIAPLSISEMKQMGGNMPGPFVGSAWSGSVSNWPGVNGISGDKNYLELNKYEPIDISRQMELNDTHIGGRRSRRRRNISRRRRKGGMVTNLGRDVMYNFNSAYNTLNGYQAPLDPAPYKGHFVSSNNLII
jgi:hypothetical protein